MRRIALVLFLSVITPFAFAGGGGGPGLTGEAVVIGDVVNVRQSPNPGGAIVAAAREGDKLTILSWEPEAVTVGTLTDRWARVRLAGGATGYVFGGFLFELEDFAGLWASVEFGGGAGYKFLADGTLEGEGFHSGETIKLTGTWTRAALRVRAAFQSPSASNFDLYLSRFKGRRCLVPTKRAPSAPVSKDYMTSGGVPIGFFFKQSE